MVRLPRNEKANILIELQGLKCDHQVWPWPWPWPLNFEGQMWPWPLTTYMIFTVKFWNICISEWEGRLTLHKGGGSRSFMTMTMTIWWPRSGAWIYQIVTGVTSVVGVPSTHLVNTLRAKQNGHHFAENIFKPIFLSETVVFWFKFN